jgi:hypothetical protein
MEKTLVRVPVVCPECGREWLTEFSALALAEALDVGASIRLYARCHDRVWAATAPERDQLRAYLEVAN